MAPTQAKKSATASDKAASTRKFLDFLVRLAEEKNLLEAFEKDPVAAMKKAGLTPAQRKALLGGNLAQIRFHIRHVAICLPTKPPNCFELILIKPKGKR
jgi:hypothetical protein